MSTTLRGQKLDLDDDTTLFTTVSLEDCGHYQYQFTVLRHCEQLDEALTLARKQLEIAATPRSGEILDLTSKQLDRLDKTDVILDDDGDEADGAGG